MNDNCDSLDNKINNNSGFGWWIVVWVLKNIMKGSQLQNEQVSIVIEDDYDLARNKTALFPIHLYAGKHILRYPSRFNSQHHFYPEIFICLHRFLFS